MNAFASLSVNEARRRHFELLDGEWDELAERQADSTTWEDASCCCGSVAKAELLFEKKGTRFVRCPACTTIFVSPQLTEKALSDHFTHSPAWEAWSRVLLDPDQMAFDRGKYEGALDHLDALRPNGGRLLDVGANSGVFLDAARKRNWQVDGIEPSEAACDVAREQLGIDLFCGTFAAFPAQAASYDLITFWASLEYTRHPEKSIDRARELLAPEGLLLIFVSGNSHSLVMRMLKQHCIGYLFNRPWYFSPQGLDALVLRPGIELLERHSIIPSLDVVQRYLDDREPYGTEEPALFTDGQIDLLERLIAENHMGYKFQSIYRVAA